MLWTMNIWIKLVLISLFKYIYWNSRVCLDKRNDLRTTQMNNVRMCQSETTICSCKHEPIGLFELSAASLLFRQAALKCLRCWVLKTNERRTSSNVKQSHLFNWKYANRQTTIGEHRCFTITKKGFRQAFQCIGNIYYRKTIHFNVFRYQNPIF